MRLIEARFAISLWVALFVYVVYRAKLIFEILLPE